MDSENVDFEEGVGFSYEVKRTIEGVDFTYNGYSGYWEAERIYPNGGKWRINQCADCLEIAEARLRAFLRGENRPGYWEDDGENRHPYIDLYKVHSSGTDTLGYKCLGISWYYRKREEPVAPYEKLIEDYTDGGEPWEWVDEEFMVNEMFTPAEALQLAEYIATTYGMDTLIERVRIPFRNEHAHIPYAWEEFGGDTYYLWEEDGYPLPFRVDGRLGYSLKPSKRLHPGSIEIGEVYIRRALEHLGFGGLGQMDLITTEEIRAAVEALYNEGAYYVGCGTPTRERLRRVEPDATPKEA